MQQVLEFGLLLCAQKALMFLVCSGEKSTLSYNACLREAYMTYVQEEAD